MGEAARTSREVWGEHNISRGTWNVASNKCPELFRWPGPASPLARTDMNSSLEMGQLCESMLRANQVSQSHLPPFSSLHPFHKHAQINVTTLTDTHICKHCQVQCPRKDSPGVDSWLALRRESQNRTEQMLAMGKCGRRNTEGHAQPEREEEGTLETAVAIIKWYLNLGYIPAFRQRSHRAVPASLERAVAPILAGGMF